MKSKAYLLVCYSLHERTSPVKARFEDVPSVVPHLVHYSSAINFSFSEPIGCRRVNTSVILASAVYSKTLAKIYSTTSAICSITFTLLATRRCKLPQVVLQCTMLTVEQSGEYAYDLPYAWSMQAATSGTAVHHADSRPIRLICIRPSRCIEFTVTHNRQHWSTHLCALQSTAHTQGTATM